MRTFLALTTAALAGATKDVGAPVKQKYPWYHSTDEIHAELDSMVQNCSGADAHMYREQTAGLDVLRVRGKGKKANPVAKAFIVFGEHARELISPETALGMARSLCGRGDAESVRMAQSALEKVEFVLVPNANPMGRRKVEQGEYCKRTNEDGVDLNRNWGGDHADKKVKQGSEDYPGPRGFSEPESQALRDLVSQERPDLFLSVHSGAYLLGSPWGYQDGEPDNNRDVREILGPIAQKYCNGDCPYGGLADMIGYKSKGCDIDWVREQVGVPYTFTWEIYTGADYKDDYVKKAKEQRGEIPRSFAQLGRRAPRRGGTGRRQGRLGRGHLALDQEDPYGVHGAAAPPEDPKAEVAALAEELRDAGPAPEDAEEEPEDKEDAEACAEQFIPQTKEDTDDTVLMWSQALLDVSTAVAQKLHPEAFTADLAAAASAVTSPPMQEDHVELQAMVASWPTFKEDAASTTSAQEPVAETTTTTDSVFAPEPRQDSEAAADAAAVAAPSAEHFQDAAAAAAPQPFRTEVAAAAVPESLQAEAVPDAPAKEKVDLDSLSWTAPRSPLDAFLGAASA